MISYSPKEETYIHRNISKNEINTPEKREKLINRFTEEYKPIEVYYNEELLQIIYFGNSPLINKIKYYPIALIFIMLLFFFAIYFFFRTACCSEKEINSKKEKQHYKNECNRIIFNFVDQWRISKIDNL